MGGDEVEGSVADVHRSLERNSRKGGAVDGGNGVGCKGRIEEDGANAHGAHRKPRAREFGMMKYVVTVFDTSYRGRKLPSGRISPYNIMHLKTTALSHTLVNLHSHQKAQQGWK